MSTPDTPFAAWTDVTFVKGHGTQNDFVVLTDPAVELDPICPLRTRTLWVIHQTRPSRPSTP
mgnify:CR=1 FL=1